MGDRFVSASALEEARKQRQEEWELVRKPEDPLEAPNEETDHRPLFFRLKEVEEKRKAESEEENRLKNMVRGLDTDEATFLAHVNDHAKQEEAKKRAEEQEIMKQIGMHTVVSVEEAGPSVPRRIRRDSVSKPSKQAELLRSAIKRKGQENKMPAVKEVHKRKRVDWFPTLSSDSASSSGSSTSLVDSRGESEASSESKAPLVADKLTDLSQTLSANKSEGHPTARKLVGVLPSLVEYMSSSGSSSSSENESDSSQDENSVLPVLTQLAPEKLDRSGPPQGYQEAQSSDEQ